MCTSHLLYTLNIYIVYFNRKTEVVSDAHTTAVSYIVFQVSFVLSVMYLHTEESDTKIYKMVAFLDLINSFFFSFFLLSDTENLLDRKTCSRCEMFYSCHFSLEGPQ